MVVLEGAALSYERGTPVHVRTAAEPRTSRDPASANCVAEGVRALNDTGLRAISRPDIWSKPPRRQPRGKTIVSLVNSHTNATSKR